MDQASSASSEEVMETRGQVYGDYKVSMQSAALILQGLLEMHYQQSLPGPIPPHVVGQFMVGIKASRACAPFSFSEDSYVDAHNYLDIAKDCDPRSHDD